MALYFVKIKGRIGRKKLASHLNVGEGSARHILNILHKHNLISIKRSGAALTPKGGRVIAKYMVHHALLEHAAKHTVDKRNVAVHVQGACSKIKNGIEERDYAIMMGASGATTLKVMNGKIMLGDLCIDETNAALAEELRSKFLLQNGDAIIIGSSKCEKTALLGAMHAAYRLTGANEYFSSIFQHN